MRNKHLFLMALVASISCVRSQLRRPASSTCDLTDAASLSGCIKTLLVESRDELREEVDPLHVDDFPFSDKDVRGTLRNINVHGLSCYQVDRLTVTFPRPTEIAVNATLNWPYLNAKMDGTLRTCWKMIWKQCINIRGRPFVEVSRTTGALNTTLAISLTPEGQLVATSYNTTVTVDMQSIRVDPHLRGVVGLAAKLITNPTRLASAMVQNLWWDKKEKIEAEAASALDEVVKKELTVNLAKLLNTGSVAVPVSKVAPTPPAARGRPSSRAGGRRRSTRDRCQAPGAVGGSRRSRGSAGQASTRTRSRSTRPVYPVNSTRSGPRSRSGSARHSGGRRSGPVRHLGGRRSGPVRHLGGRRSGSARHSGGRRSGSVRHSGGRRSGSARHSGGRRSGPAVLRSRSRATAPQEPAEP